MLKQDKLTCFLSGLAALGLLLWTLSYLTLTLWRLLL